MKTRDEIIAVREHRFRRTIDDILAHPAYVTEFPEVRSLAGKGTESLGLMPVLLPERLSLLSPPHSMAMVCKSLESGVVLASGGTSGSRKTVYHTWDSFREVMAMGARGLLAGLGAPPKRIANCFLPGSLWGGFLFGNGVAEALGAQLYAMGRPPLHELVEVMETHGVDCLFSSPSFASSFLLSDEANPARLSALSTFCYVGESMPQAHATAILAKFPSLRIRSLAYTTNETGPIGFQCRHQSGGHHHIHEDFVVVELLDPDTGVAITEPGREGDVIVTTIGNDGMPLLRYRIGDRAEFTQNSCPCGSAMATLNLIGRSPRSMNVCGTVLSAENVLRVLSTVSALTLADVQLTVTRRKSGKTDLTISVSDQAVDDMGLNVMESAVRGDELMAHIIKEPQFGRLALRRVSPASFALSTASGKKLIFQESNE